MYLKVCWMHFSDYLFESRLRRDPEEGIQNSGSTPGESIIA